VEPSPVAARDIPSAVTQKYATTLGPLLQHPDWRSHMTSPNHAAVATVETAIPSPSAPTWINYTGCDSLYSVATDSTTVTGTIHIYCRRTVRNAIVTLATSTGTARP